MFIQGVFAGRRRSAFTPGCRVSTPGLQGVDAVQRPALRRRRRQCARVFQWGWLHLQRNASCMQPALRSYATCTRRYAGCCNLQPPAYRRNAACMQPALRPSVAPALVVALIYTSC